MLCALFAWRDGVCREEDESTGYVMPKAQLAMLAQEQPGRNWFGVRDLMPVDGNRSRAGCLNGHKAVGEIMA